MRFGSLEFRPGLWPTLITLIMFGILVSLGFWQLDRAAQKRALLEEYRAETNDAPLRLDPLRENYQGMGYRVVVASGHFDGARQLLLDNRTYNGRVGYQVLTPFVLDGTERRVLVNRGWVPLGNNRDALPDLPVPAGKQHIIARIKLPSDKIFMLADEEPRKGWPWRVQAVQIELFEKELGYPLMPLILLLESDTGDGFVRDWHPLTYGPERNEGYAVQWFGLALTLLIIYLVVNTSKVDKAHE
ncbi:surfeit locus 1 family protein [Thiogranum longum]|uniref:SURF1-like protein n=1 Tax=Thiogranum longum TaxID=1537524 RepID=A0A4R1H992_9GAMM|nr:SURF1 family protein [Thiogranum longum]TCK17081.1 surfeit locus 1 family protein [Thiogranum longum]